MVALFCIGGTVQQGFDPDDFERYSTIWPYDLVEGTGMTFRVGSATQNVQVHHNTVKRWDIRTKTR